MLLPAVSAEPIVARQPSMPPAPIAAGVDLPSALQWRGKDFNGLHLNDFTEPSPLRLQCAA